MIGPWPGPCPVPAGARVGLWDDGSPGARVAAAWLTLGGLDWVPLAFTPAGAMHTPGGWGPAQAAAAAAGATWLVLPWCRSDEGALLAWANVEAALADAGMGLWLPFCRLDAKALRRLAGAVGVDVQRCAEPRPSGAWP